MSMEKRVFVVFTNAIEGQEKIYNEWCADVHLKDVLKVPGIVIAWRLRGAGIKEYAARNGFKRVEHADILADSPNRRAVTPLFRLPWV
jgi:hypothetical protein